MSSFKQSRLHLDAFDATQLAREGTYFISGAFKNDGNDAVITTREALTAVSELLTFAEATIFIALVIFLVL